MLFLTLFILAFCLLPIQTDSFWQGLLDEDVCETKECYDAAEHIKKWMNPAFKPCEDFYEYACGYWHNPNNTTVNKVHNMSIGSRDGIVSFHLKNFLLDEDIAKESRLFLMLKQFLTMCLDEESIEARGVKPAVEALRRAGGWPVLEQDWSQENWNIENGVTAFGGRGGALLDINVIYGTNFTNWTLGIQIETPDYNLLSVKNLSQGFQNETIQKYYRMGCELIQAFGVDKKKAEEDMKEIVEFEIAFAELVKESKNSSDFYTVYDITLSELQNNVSWIDWTKMLTNVLPESVSIKKNDSIKVSSINLLNDLGELITNYPKRTVANYVMWKFALKLTEYLPAKVSNITSSNERRYHYKTRYEQCAAFVEESSLLGAAALYIAKQTEDDTKAAKEMTENILNELLIDISELEWLDDKTRSFALKTLHDTKVHISFPEEATDLNALEETYKEVKINSSYFFEAMMDSNRWIEKNRYETIGKPTAELSLKDKLEMALSVSAHFRPGANIIVVSAGFLHFLPLFSSKVPAYVNYGHLGGVVAHELTHALDFQTDEREAGWCRHPDISGPDYRFGEGIAIMNRWGSNETEEIYDAKKQCIIDQYSSFNDTKYTGQMIDGNYTDRENIADNGGFKLALRAYRRLVSNLVSPEPRLPTLQQYSPEQLFILSLANTYCEVPDKEKLSQQMKYDTHSPFEFRVRGVLMNSPDFSELFHCQKNDPMNPDEKCEVW